MKKKSSYHFFNYFTANNGQNYEKKIQILSVFSLITTQTSIPEPLNTEF